jgi:NAD-dependent dihydropyrimidine dehydrogenase PreA subunit
MAFFIGADCVDVRDRSCVEECPVDCIYEGSRKLYIQPAECIDCGACEAVCPVNAISSDMRMSEEERRWHDDNGAFFTEVLRGRSSPLGSPGGATGTGPVEADTALAASLPVVVSQTD